MRRAHARPLPLAGQGLRCSASPSARCWSSPRRMVCCPSTPQQVSPAIFPLCETSRRRVCVSVWRLSLSFRPAFRVSAFRAVPTRNARGSPPRGTRRRGGRHCVCRRPARVYAQVPTPRLRACARGTGRPARPVRCAAEGWGARRASCVCWFASQEPRGDRLPWVLSRACPWGLRE